MKKQLAIVGGGAAGVSLAWLAATSPRVLGDWQVDLASRGRTVLTAVFDSTQAQADRRVVLYVDGSEQPRFSGTPPALDAGLDLSQADAACVGNRDMGVSSDRSPTGTIAYVALYDRALDAAEVATHAERLLLSDD